MDDDSSPYPSITRTVLLVAVIASMAWMLYGRAPAPDHTGAANPSMTAAGVAYAQGVGGGSNENATLPWTTYLPVPILILAGILVLCSAFFSGSEAAFFSLHQVRLRSMSQSTSRLDKLVARMMESPGRLLTTILVGNTIVNVLIGTLLGARVEDVFSKAWHLSDGLAYLYAILLVTFTLVFFGEITPKVFAVRASDFFARTAALPLQGFDRAIAPVRQSLLSLTNYLFRITRFHELRAAPFITDDELKSVISDVHEQGVIEEDERHMIEGILEFSDATLHEIFIPRPDVIALTEDATVNDALDAYREHEYSRMPMFAENFDKVTGIVVIKDLLPAYARGELDVPVKQFMRQPHFVPQTITVQQFIKNAQRLRAHLAIVVDEYGGTEGIVTLHDALEEVVGDIHDEDEVEEIPYEKLSPNSYRLKGSFSLDDLSELVNVPLHDEEHQTVAGLLMNRIEKVPEPGDVLEIDGLRFTVESCEGKRVASVQVEIVTPRPEDTEQW